MTNWLRIVSRFAGRAGGQACIAPAAASALAAAEITDDLAAEAHALSFPAVPAPAVSIVVPVFNQLRFTLQCLKALALQQSRYRFEVILTDDASTDATGPLLEAMPGLRYVRNPENLGFLRSCNRAAAAARGEFLVFLNNDTVVLPGWLDALIDTFTEHPRAGYVGSMFLWPDGRLQEAGSMVAGDGSVWMVAQDEDADGWQYNFVRETDYCSGAAIAVPLSQWRRLGGFDTQFAPAYYEDVDLAFGVHAAGAQVLYQPFARCIHFAGVSAAPAPGKNTALQIGANRPILRAKWATRLAAQPPNMEALKASFMRGRRRMLWIASTPAGPHDASGGAADFRALVELRAAGWDVDVLPTAAPDLARSASVPLRRAGIACIYGVSPAGYLRQHGASYEAICVAPMRAQRRWLKAVRCAAPQARIVAHGTAP